MVIWEAVLVATCMGLVLPLTLIGVSAVKHKEIPINSRSLCSVMSLVVTSVYIWIISWITNLSVTTRVITVVISLPTVFGLSELLLWSWQKRVLPRLSLRLRHRGMTLSSDKYQGPLTWEIAGTLALEMWRRISSLTPEELRQAKWKAAGIKYEVLTSLQSEAIARFCGKRKGPLYDCWLCEVRDAAHQKYHSKSFGQSTVQSYNDSEDCCNSFCPLVSCTDKGSAYSLWLYHIATENYERAKIQAERIVATLEKFARGYDVLRSCSGVDAESNVIDANS